MALFDHEAERTPVRQGNRVVNLSSLRLSPQIQSKSHSSPSHYRRAHPRLLLFPAMNPHHHLHQSTSTSNLSNLSKDSGGSNGSSRARARLFSKINKLVRPTDSIFGGLKSSPSPRSSTNISDLSSVGPFQIVHERDETPMYTPTRPMQPRTNSECQKALEEMFAHTRGEATERRSEEMEPAKSTDVKKVERPHPNQRYVDS